MHDITKTRILLTTAVFAAVAAVFAGGANARIPEEDGSGIGVEPVAVVGATVDPLASSSLTGLLSSLSPKERSNLKSMTAVCSVVLCQPDEWLAARLGFASRQRSNAAAQQVPRRLPRPSLAGTKCRADDRRSVAQVDDTAAAQS
jgi:hypothetical protein